MTEVVSVIIPSRLASVREEDPDELWLERAIESVRRQVVSKNIRIEIIVGTNHGKYPPDRLHRSHEWIWFTNALENQTGQAAAINAAAAKAQGKYLAILEYDDRWRPIFLNHALEAIVDCDFVSSNQFAAPSESNVGKIEDFPIPSGWFMRRELWDEIGGMDTTYRYHLDNDWLGRLSDAGKRRTHLVEATSAVEMEALSKLRPLLHAFVEANPELNVLFRHGDKVPLVLRTKNPLGGMSTILSDP